MTEPMTEPTTEATADVMPDAERLARLRREARPGPIQLLNLLEFRRPDGRAAFDRYAAVSLPLVLAHGGQPLAGGEAGTVLAGEGGWDLVVAMRFPDVEHFIGLVTDERYQRDAVPLRVEALARTLWMAFQPAS
jgi:uncharacterized protein (DUF1330 family)